MKKLVFLLVLCLCMSSMPVTASSWQRAARAEGASESKSEGKAKKAGESSKKSKKKADKSKDEAEKEYVYDLDGDSEVMLSVVLKKAKTKIKVADVKSVEATKKKYVDYVAWARDKKHKDDFIIAALKDFDKVKLRVKTKKTSIILVIKNGAAAKVEEPKEPSGKKKTEHEKNRPKSQMKRKL